MRCNIASKLSENQTGNIAELFATYDFASVCLCFSLRLLIALSGGKLKPISLDINVSFLAPAHPGKLISEAEVIKLGKSIGYFSSSLYQQEKLVATATSTIKLIPMPEEFFDT